MRNGWCLEPEERGRSRECCPGCGPCTRHLIRLPSNARPLHSAPPSPPDSLPISRPVGGDFSHALSDRVSNPPITPLPCTKLPLFLLNGGAASGCGGSSPSRTVLGDVWHFPRPLPVPAFCSPACFPVIRITPHSSVFSLKAIKGWGAFQVISSLSGLFLNPGVCKNNTQQIQSDQKRVAVRTSPSP